MGRNPSPLQRGGGALGVGQGTAHDEIIEHGTVPFSGDAMAKTVPLKPAYAGGRPADTGAALSLSHFRASDTRCTSSSWVRSTRWV